MTCVICDSPLSGRQTRACSKACKLQDDTNQRRESGRLRTANMSAEAKEKKKARNRAWQEQLAPRQCRVCKETQLVRVGHSRTRRTCKKCAPLWSNKTPSASTDLVKAQPNSIANTSPQGGTFYLGTCLQCNISAWSRYEFKYCSPKCKQKASDIRRGKTRWITDSKRIAIYERDNYTCQLCLKPVPKGYDYQSWGWSPHAPSLDHIIPRSLGGPDSPDNLQLAHSICNSRKGNKDSLDFYKA